MAYQIGLPILILKEAGVVEEGVLERGVVGMYMPEFSLEDNSQDDHYLHSEEWAQISKLWEARVKDFYHGKSVQVPRAKDTPTIEKRVSSPDNPSALDVTDMYQPRPRPKDNQANNFDRTSSEEIGVSHWIGRRLMHGVPHQAGLDPTSSGKDIREQVYQMDRHPTRMAKVVD